MRFVLLILPILFSSCNNSDSYHRGYVISQVQDAGSEKEVVTEPLLSE